MFNELDRWDFADGGRSAFNRIKETLGKSDPLSLDDTAVIIRALIKENIKFAWDEAEKNYQHEKKLYNEFKKTGLDWGKPELDDSYPKRVESLLEKLNEEFKESK